MFKCKMMLTRNSNAGACAVATFFLSWFFVGTGWLMNIQNLWQWWPASNRVADVGIEWIVSLVGVFVFPVGAVTGWLF